MPVAGYIRKEHVTKDPQYVAVAFYVLPCAGMAFCVYCLLLNFHYRHDR